MPEHPPTDAGIPQEAHQQSLGGGVGPVRCGHQQPPCRRRAAPADVAAEGPVHRWEPDVALQRAVEEDRSVGERHRGLQCGQRPGGEPQVAIADNIDRCEVPPPHLYAGRAPGRAPARDRELDGSRRPVQHAVPVGRRRPGHHRALAGPQRRRANPHLVREPVTREQIDRRVQAPPRPLPRSPLHRRRGHTAGDGLPQGEHTTLPADQVIQRHGASIDGRPPRPWPFGRTRRHDQRLGDMSCTRAAHVTQPAITPALLTIGRHLPA
jgi:hypothetical protein